MREASYQLSEIVAKIRTETSCYLGPGTDPALVITGIREPDKAGPSDIVVAQDERRAAQAFGGRAACVIIQEGIAPGEKPHLVVGNARLAMAAVLEMFDPAETPRPGIDLRAVVSDSAVVAPTASVGARAIIEDGARIGERAVIYPGVYIGRDVVIGEDTVIFPNAVVLDRVRVGARVRIHSGAVIGSDGFGYIATASGHRKVPQIGTVVIEDDVEIGANSCVDRATIGETVIGRGTKIDNLVQVAHNVRIGEHCILVGCSAVAGSSTLGDRATLAGGAGVADHVHVGEGAVIGAMSLVTGDVPPGGFYSGSPARPHAEELRVKASIRKVPELRKALKELEDRLRALEEKIKP